MSIRPSGKAKREEDRQAGRALESRLKHDTGYNAYADYLNFKIPEQPDLVDLRDQLLRHHLPAVKAVSQHCSVIDVTKSQDWSFNRTFDGRQALEANLLDALHAPAAGVSLRIVVWHLDRGEWGGLPYVDILGLTLHLDPRYFTSLLVKIKPWADATTEPRPLYANHLLMGNHVVAFGRIALKQGDSVPYVVMAGLSDGGDPLSRASRNTLHDYSFHQDICQITCSDTRKARLSLETVRHRVSGCNREEGGPFGIEDLEVVVEDWTHWYIHLLRHHLVSLQVNEGSLDSLQIASLYPVLQLGSLSARDRCRPIRATLESFPTVDDSKMNGLNIHRRILRRWLEDTENNIEHLRRYIILNQGPAWLDNPALIILERESAQLVAQSRRLEAEVRDVLQLQSGSSALEETKKSIELSTLQIEESRRLKIFTILAFIYVPLNLATSIFGMNLQQLNANGQPLRVFIITAVLALFFTGAAWFSVDQFNGWTTWRHTEPTHYDHRTRTSFALTVRMSMLWWLIRNGHFTWMRKSGAGLCILINSQCEPYGYPINLPDHAWHLSAGEYVSKFSRGYKDDVFEPFSTDPVPVHWLQKHSRADLVDAESFSSPPQ
ncbi:MAG: hypothetical protein Q9222_002134 [Ikaeria aurantiellina]